MPVYNAERYLYEAVESILNQTFTDFEFVIVDDGSTDASLDVLRKYESQDTRIVLITQSNMGIVSALNNGLSQCRGELIARMDADDISLPERFAKQLEFLRRNPNCVAVGSSHLNIDADGDPLSIVYREADPEKLRQIMFENAGSGMAHCAVLMRRGPLVQVGGYREEYKWTEDCDLWLRLLERGMITNLPDVLMKVRKSLNSVTHSIYEGIAEKRISMGLEAIKRFNLSDELEGRLRKRFSRHGTPKTRSDYYERWCRLAIRHGFAKTARKYAFRLVITRPQTPQTWKLLIKAILGQRLIDVIKRSHLES